MSNNPQTLKQAERINSLTPKEVIRDDYVRSQFIFVYNTIWKEGGEAAYEREAAYFIAQLDEKKQLAECTGTSVFLSFIDLAVRGLTLEPGTQPLCYLLPRGGEYVTGNGGRQVWKNHCNLTISPYGELVLRTRAGQILHADNPVIVYEGDGFEYGERDGSKYVNYCCRLPHTSQKIIACFIKITRPDGTTDYSVMTESDWKRLQDYSAKNRNGFAKKGNDSDNDGKANALYTSGDSGQIDTGFLKAKCIKHAFKTYPKIAIGKGMQLETDIVDEPQQPGATQQFDPYAGIDTAAGAPREEKTFAPAPDTSAGITVQADEDDTF